MMHMKHQTQVKQQFTKNYKERFIMRFKFRSLLAVFLVVSMLCMLPAIVFAANEIDYSNETGVETEEESAADPDTGYESDLVSELDREVEPDQEESDTDTVDGVNNSISGMLWLDLNDDGIRDANEPAIANYPVYLCKSDNLYNVVQTAYTNESGAYSFIDIEPGAYVVGVKPNELEADKYLLPLVGIKNDNKFNIDSDTWLSAITNSIQVSEDTTITGIDSGMRSAMEIKALSADDEASLRAAVAAAQTGDVITLLNDIVLTGSALNVPAGKVITMGGGKTLTGADGREVISVSGDLTLADITITHVSGQSGRGVYVAAGGKLTMQAGAIISGNTTSGDGGGVYLTGANSTFTMNGGEISGNTTTYGGGVYLNGSTFIMNGGVISGNTATTYGGGVCMNGANSRFNINSGVISGNTANTFGGGVYMMGGAFVMKYGVISNNIITTNSGGGVYVSYGSFTMENGMISGNTARSNGGGVHMASTCTFTMYSGEISGNTASIGFGGGVSATTSSSTFTMYDGTISDNKANNTYGGGVYVTSTFNMEYGEILGNSANNGGGVYAHGGAFTMKNGLVSGNMATNSGGGMYVTGTNSTITIDSGEIVDNKATYNGGGVYVGVGGNFTMKEDGEISDNKTTYGGGVYVTNNSVFILAGGEVVNNTASGDGGGVNVAGTFVMKSGRVSDNTAKSNGGGVYMNYSTITMEGGEISDNTSNSAYGGGVFMGSGSAFTINGGKINGNTAPNNGGGVYVTGNNSTLNMKSGEINGNTTERNGGGVYMNSSDFIMEGGAIRNNTASGDGGGIFTAVYSRLTLPDDTSVAFSGNRAGSLHTPPDTAPVPEDQWQGNASSISPNLPGDKSITVFNNYDINYIAGEEIPLYAVTYNANGGSGTAPTESDKFEDEAFSVADDTFIAPAGKRFAEWNTAADGSGTAYATGDEVIMPAHDLTLYAVWKPIPYSVTYDANGGSGEAPTESGKIADEVFDAANNTFTAPEDMRFAGWNTAADGSGEVYAAGDAITMPAHDLTLYAVWEPIIYYSVTYDANGGSGEAPTESDKFEGEVFNAADNTFTAPEKDMQFAGWSTATDGSEVYTAGDTITMPAYDVTLYAVWKTITLGTDPLTPQNPSPASPKTGDTLNVLLWAVLSGMALTVGIIAGHKKRQRQIK